MKNVRIKKLGDVIVMINKSIPTTEGREFLKGMGFLFLREGKNVRLMIQELDNFILFQHDDLFVLTKELQNNSNVNIDRNVNLISVDVQNVGFTLHFVIHVVENWVKVDRSFT